MASVRDRRVGGRSRALGVLSLHAQRIVPSRSYALAAPPDEPVATGMHRSLDGDWSLRPWTHNDRELVIIGGRELTQ